MAFWKSIVTTFYGNKNIDVALESTEYRLLPSSGNENWEGADNRDHEGGEEILDTILLGFGTSKKR